VLLSNKASDNVTVHVVKLQKNQTNNE